MRKPVGEYALRYDITSLQDSINETLTIEYRDTPVDERDAYLRREAVEFISAHPGRALWNAVLKSWRYWDPRLEDARLTPLFWNLAYTELYFSDVLWPDFNENHLDEALDFFHGRQRRFGRTTEQVEA